MIKRLLIVIGIIIFTCVFILSIIWMMIYTIPDWIITGDTNYSQKIVQNLVEWLNKMESKYVET